MASWKSDIDTLLKIEIQVMKNPAGENTENEPYYMFQIFH